MNIPGIYKISFGSAAALKINQYDIFQQERNKSYKITAHNSWQQIKFIGFPTLTESMEVENGQPIYNVELSWFSTEPYLFNRNVFKVEDVNGNNWLVGTDAKPYTRMSRTYSDAGPTNKKGYQYKIVYRNIIGLINLMP